MPKVLSEKWLNLEGAKTACKLFGNTWNVTKVFADSLICSTLSTNKSCGKCDSMRLLAWINGSIDSFKYPNNKKNKEIKTLAGQYYCADETEHGCSDLRRRGYWAKGRRG